MGLPIDYAVRNLGRSPTRLMLSVVGSLLVVLLVLAAGGFVRGMDRSLLVASGDENVLFFGVGSEESIERSEIGAAVPSLVLAGVPGIRSQAGVAFISPEVHMQSSVHTDAGQHSEPAQLLVRGITPAAWLVHGSTRILTGRMPEGGRDEIAVGRLVHQRLGVSADALQPGRSIWFHNRQWSIVGVVESPASVIESEIWCPLADLQIAARRDNLSCVVATLDTGTFDDADTFARQRLDLELVAMREADYYRKLADFFAPVRMLVWVTALLIAGGGLLGGLNTMYAAFASRVREIGALQAMGFSRATIVKSLVQESVLAALAGTLLAVVVGLLMLNGVTVQFSLGAFGLMIDPPIVLLGIGVGLLVGCIGALPPAVRCLRLPITEALKAD